MTKYTDKILEAINKVLPKDQKETELLGFINESKEVFTFGHDSKIVGRLFEVLAEPYLQKVAKELGYTLHESTNQTAYPDFYFEDENKRRYAVDIKSTYRRSRISFTQGSFTSYLRDNTKNIDGNYTMYDKHYIIMFLYDREANPSHGSYQIDSLSKIVPAYKNVEVAVSEKYRVGGDQPGSGNTDNIGTIRAKTFEPFKYGWGPFAFLGNDVYEDYWRNYPRNRLSAKEKEKLYRTLPGYFDWLENKGEKERSDDYRKKYQEYLDFVASKGWDIL